MYVLQASDSKTQKMLGIVICDLLGVYLDAE